MGVFKACDIRGVADTELTDETALRISQAIGVKLTGKSVVIGGDFRHSTARLKAILTESLAAAGCHVFDIGNVATPVFYYAQGALGAQGGVMVTASHNPPEYNGFKIVLGNLPIRESELKEIEALARRGASARGTGRVERLDIGAQYIAATAAKAARGALKVVLDAGNGAAGAFAPQLYRRLGYDVVPLFCTPDGSFPNRAPNPAIAENLAKLGETVRETGADIGVAFDGDGDRAGFVDERGNAMDNDAALVLLARRYLEEGPGAVIYDAKCSMAVPEEIAKAGGRPVMARAGHTFSKRAFLEENALFAGELSGHFFFRALGYDDGMFAGLKMCEYAAQRGPLSALARSVPRYCLTEEIRIRYEADDKEAVLDAIAGRLPAAQVNRIDGVRLELAAGWGMIRASVTEPLFTLRFEAKTKARLLEIEQQLIAALPASIRGAVEREAEKANEGL